MRLARVKQESPAIADKPARRESLPKLLQFDVPTTLSLTILAYNTADNSLLRLTAIASEIREIPINSLEIQTYGVQGHPRSLILVSIESPYVSEIFLPQLFRRRLLASGQDRQQTLHTCYFWQAASAGVQSTAPAHSKCAYAA